MHEHEEDLQPVIDPALRRASLPVPVPVPVPDESAGWDRTHPLDAPRPTDLPWDDGD